jgi:hypothetical protein
MFIHLDDQKLVGGKKKRKKVKSARWNSFHPRTSASRALVFRPRAPILLHFGQAPCSPPIFPPLLPTDQTLLSSLHLHSCCHHPCPPLPFADQTLVSSPHPSALHYCPSPPLLPPQPCYSLEGIVAVLKVLFLDLNEAILLIVFSSFLLWSPSISAKLFC